MKILYLGRISLGLGVNRMKKAKLLNLCLVTAATFVGSVFAGYLSYVIISGEPIFRRDAGENLPSSEVFTEIVLPVDAIAADTSDVYAPTEIVIEEFYVARENDGRIGIFRSRNGDETFLYNIDTHVRTLPEADQELLRNGVVLRTREELTMFEEDFSS